ncbi:MAG: histidine kinase [Cytophagales bacterium]|nr:histidine kinase [Cytophagales bacterium]
MSLIENKFIFANDPKHRLGRHLVFWVVWWLFFALIYGSRPIGPSSPAWFSYQVAYSYAALESLLFLPGHIMFSYVIIYLLIPSFLLRGKYGWFLVGLLVLIPANAAFSNQLTIWLVNPIRRALDIPMPHDNFYFGLMSGLRGGLQTGGFAAMITLAKHFYRKDRANQQLVREKLTAELQLLKAQVHPHFLFNTLNNLYSLTLLKSDLAPEVVLKLSALLRYMLYECNAPLVPLTREIRMMQDYVELEKLRYGARLDLAVNVQGDPGGKTVAPLLLLPFLENAFKHGASEQLDQAWIALDLTVKGTLLKMKLINGVPEAAGPARPGTGAHGIGLQNVRKRLDLLYPGRHELKILREAETFMVTLSITLETNADRQPAVLTVGRETGGGVPTRAVLRDA